MRITKRILSVSFDIFLVVWTLTLVLDDFGIPITTAAFHLILVIPALWLKVLLRLDLGLLPKPIDLLIFGPFYERRKQFALMGVSLGFSFFSLEMLFRNYLDLLPQNIANEIGTRYRVGGGGIYLFDYEVMIHRMRPNYTTSMYYNGYRWRHVTDSRGYRNSKEYATADIVLIGDSMIYGHGVESESTVASKLEVLTKKNVYNMGRQGASIQQEYEYFVHDALGLRPAWVFVFFLNNDLNDLLIGLTLKEQFEFIQTPISDFEHPYKVPGIAPTSGIYHTIKDRLSYSPTLRIYFGLMRAVRLKRIMKSFTAESAENTASQSNASEQRHQSASLLPMILAESSGFRTDSPLQEKQSVESGYDDFLNEYKDSAPFSENPRYLSAMKFQLHALRKLQYLSHNQCLRWALIYIYTGQPYDEIYQDILGEFCRLKDINYLNLEGAFEKEKEAGLFLPNDGHFTDQGALVTARALIERFGL